MENISVSRAKQFKSCKLAYKYIYDDNFMGTGIQLGSDKFKTWDEIITYFERLGGQ